MDTEGKEIKKQSPKSEVYIMKARQTTFEERVAIVEYYLNHIRPYLSVDPKISSSWK